MRKYLVRFETAYQSDGWSDFRDREYKTVREQITVQARNIKLARRVAAKEANGYLYKGWGPIKANRWDVSDIKKIIPVLKKTK